MPALTTEIFISYAWKGESEALVNELDAVLKAKGVTIVRDKRDLGYKGSIGNFMSRIGKGKYVIVVISDKYLKSENCMYELLEVSKSGDFYERIYPIVLDDANIYKPIDRVPYLEYWEGEVQKLSDEIKSLDNLANSGNLIESLTFYQEVRQRIDNLTHILKDMNTLSPAMHRGSNFEELYQAIEEQIKQDGGGEPSVSDLGHYLYLKCNRTKQQQTFHTSFAANLIQSKVQFYSMCCEEEDIPNSMIERFRTEFMDPKLNGKLRYEKIFYTVELDELENNREDIKYQLATKFDLDPNLPLDASTISKLVKDRGLKAAVVSHQLTLKKWETVSRSTLCWLVHDFWSAIPGGADDPHFIIFINLVTSELKPSGLFSFFNKNKLKKTKDEILEALKKNCRHPIESLDDPPKITRSHVMQWAQNNNLYEHIPSVINRVLDNVFKEEEEVPMQLIIGKLEEIMNKYHEHTQA